MEERVVLLLQEEGKTEMEISACPATTARDLLYPAGVVTQQPVCSRAPFSGAAGQTPRGHLVGLLPLSHCPTYGLKYHPLCFQLVSTGPSLVPYYLKST